ncbi:2-oxoglutarate dehydrogenase E1 component [Fervidibacillus halotolerans]|uniref:2-oxoglutarate dehydrogenase E1 component n=1 Tax=Fervidibacillus halotolerans TaxID=2980027 RepID=A0A9E8M2F0_9BACI|nr:2-oxoglutarate dehydrogenase E1 component [Fervidibacillus halotolerans]WAA13301.1 2-oxoglutarate dehydrogenase E1 component [Fervidibacillus halotolerans]
MSRFNEHLEDPWERFYGPNLGYIVELYDLYLKEPESVDPELKLLFEKWGPPSTPNAIQSEKVGQTSDISLDMVDKYLRAVKLAEEIRANGHLFADLNPLEKGDETFSFLEKYQLTVNDLRQLPASLISKHVPPKITNAFDAIQYLQNVYTNKIAFEFEHLEDETEKEWLTRIVETGEFLPELTDQQKIDLYKRLVEVEEFEQFLHKTYVGQKRFSIEGVDTLVPLIDEIISESLQKGVESINIGMAHRGRLNVLAHILGKPYEMIFAEFQHAPNKNLIPSEGSIGITFGWTGDVKYHLGLDRKIGGEKTYRARVTLANNPSHLEFVNPVVAGYTRAAQEDRTKVGFPDYHHDKALGILVHGDAAFPGQGVVAETLNLSGLRGYKTGGTIHIIANNMIGFTTESEDSRSTKYASDLAKGFEIPIVHVNADDPEAVLAAARLAVLYRQTFHKDFLIDLIGYRRYGHNEMDEPLATNPVLYHKIHNHPTVKDLYGEKLKDENLISAEFMKNVKEEVITKLKDAKEKVPKEKNTELDLNPPKYVESELPKVDTTVSFERLEKLNKELLKWPEGFKPFNKLEKILQRREKAFYDQKIDWAHAEALAFGSIIEDGIPVRLSGQDSERGTFAQRHIILHDFNTGKTYSPLHGLTDAKASFAVYNSPLSETSVLGFEYGYNVFAPETLVIWEAQFGDFSNSAQVIIDQFISSGRAKWGQKSGLVMLLPHGYEGQGPEHSSARLERFLSLAAENNWIVANMTKSSQYFHILRRQALLLQKEEVRPLVIMTPKSLLRHPLVASSFEDLHEGKFQPILEQPTLGQKSEKVERLILCSGKIAIDLAENLENLNDKDWLHIIRVEELYPFPMKEIGDLINRYPNLKEIAWVQEEPKNMGAWNYIEPKLHAIAPADVDVFYIGRKMRSSTAEGDPQAHKMEQTRIIKEAFQRTDQSTGKNA